ncbi:hypothetical protein, partial [Sandarakinorhabdus sp.]|uniref:hypothetical protein n=1 Tax=Sandarakinorhabdus sp. TaxID=1916663 RepID=UPI00333F6F3A
GIEQQDATVVHEISGPAQSMAVCAIIEIILGAKTLKKSSAVNKSVGAGNWRRSVSYSSACVT